MGEMIRINKLLIVGAGGHGRCCLDIARETYDEVSFLDDCHVGKQVNDCKVIGTIDEMSSFYLEYTKIFIAIGNNEVRKKLSKQAKEIGYEIVTLISKRASVSQYASIDSGCVVFPFVVIEPNAVINKECILTANTTINHDAIINEYCLLYSNTAIRPNATIGALTTIEANSLIDDGSILNK